MKNVGLHVGLVFFTAGINNPQLDTELYVASHTEIH